MAMIKEKTFNTGEVVINYAEGPDNGLVLIFLHGVTANWQSGLPLIPSFLSRHHVYALDFRGHGKSARFPGSYHVSTYTRDIRTFIEQIIKQPVVIFGHSLGGRVAIMLAGQVPELVKAIIVGDTSLTRNRLANPDFYRAFADWAELIHKGLCVNELAAALGEVASSVNPDGTVVRYKELAGWDEAYLHYTASYLKQVDPEVVELMAAGGSPSGPGELIDELPKITCPVLFLQGNPSLGALLSDRDLARARELVKTSVQVRIDNAGHGLHSMDAPSVLRAIQFFLESLES